MENQKNRPSKKQDKDFKVQLLKVYNALKVRPMTMKEVDVFTGVMRENICRYINVLQSQGKVTFIKKRRCSITGSSLVNEYTANPDLFPESNQCKFSF